LAADHRELCLAIQRRLLQLFDTVVKRTLIEAGALDVERGEGECDRPGRRDALKLLRVLLAVRQV